MSSKRVSLDRAVSGDASLSALRDQYTDSSGNDLVKVDNWQVSSGSNGLTESCTVTAVNADSTITGVGLLTYSPDGVTMYCSQYTAETSSASVSPSVTTGGFNVKAGDQVLGVVFGYAQGVEFFFEEKLTVTESSPPGGASRD